MNITPYTEQMVFNARLIRQLLSKISDEHATWKPDADSWSILEVICHLADCEVEDFRTRLDYILHKPGVKAPEIHPEQWITERAYNARDLEASVKLFSEERQRSVEWLKKLNAPQWENVYQADWGTIRAGDMFAAWVDHDLHHTRQIIELNHAWLKQQIAPYKTDYAGKW